MSSPPPNPGLVPAARHLRALFSTLTDITGALRAIAQEIQEGIEELASSGLNTNGKILINGYTDSNGNVVVVGNTDSTQDNTGDDNEDDTNAHIATLLRPFGLGHIANANTNVDADATASSDRVITPAVSRFLENLAMLPQGTRDATLRTYFHDLRDFTNNLPQDAFPREAASHRGNQTSTETHATQATGTQTTQATHMPNVQTSPVSAPSQVYVAVPTASQSTAPAPRTVPNQPSPIRFINTSFQPVISETAWHRLHEYPNPAAALLVHFLATKVPAPKPIAISHLNHGVTVIRDWQDEYLAVPAANVASNITNNVLEGKLTVAAILDGEMIEGAVGITANRLAGIEIEYEEASEAHAPVPAPGPAGPSTMTRRYTPETSPQAGPSNVPRAPSRRNSSLKSPSQRRESLQPYPSASTRASRLRVPHSAAPSPQAPAPTPSRFAAQIARINDINESFNARAPSQLLRREPSPVGDRSLRRHAALTEDTILISDPRYGGMGDLQRVIHASNPPAPTVPRTRVRLQRYGALDQDAILRASRGSNLQETVAAREENARKRREEAEANARAQEEKRRGKKRAREEDEEVVKVEKAKSEMPPSPARVPKRQKRAAVAANPVPPPLLAMVDTAGTPVAGPSSAAVGAPHLVEQAPPRRSTRLQARQAQPPAEAAAGPAAPVKKPRKKATGTRSKGKGRNGAE